MSAAEDYDTPTKRATINQISVDELDIMLSELRERRLARVKQLEAAAKVKADEAQLTLYLKFERAHGIALRYLKKCEAMEEKAEQLVHKVRVAAVVVRMEVGEEADDSEGA